MQIKRNTILKYLSQEIKIETEINSNRIKIIKDNLVLKGETVIYLCEREIRAKDNFALLYAINESKKLNLQLLCIHPKINYTHKAKESFINKQIEQAQKNFQKNKLTFEIYNGENLLEHIKNYNPVILIIDFNPILNRKWLSNLDCKIVEIDGHNICPARFISNKQEYNASTLRRKIYRNINEFLTEFPKNSLSKTESDLALIYFIKNKFETYDKNRNNPTANVLSGMSKYLNLGFISSQRVALEILKTNTLIENKETFLEELLVRKELADNFCFYNKKFKTFAGIPQWAKKTLENHKEDIRTHLYNLETFENAQTTDKLWNACQRQLVKEGIIHSYLRMYWAKKILEWTAKPEDALKISIYLNDKYAYDAPSASGYANILWAIGGLHDRAFRDWFVTGKVRRMEYHSLKKKFNTEDYIKKYE